VREDWKGELKLKEERMDMRECGEMYSLFLQQDKNVSLGTLWPWD
jgi:hypothetical protein